MLSSNAKLNDQGWASMIRDVEALYMGLQDLGQDAEGQSNSLSTIQQSVAQTNTNVTTLANRLTADEAAISALQANPATPYKTSADCLFAYGGPTNFTAGSGLTQVLIATNSLSGSLSGLNLGTGIWTCPTSGVYMVSAVASYSIGSIGTGVNGLNITNSTTSEISIQEIPAKSGASVNAVLVSYVTAGQTVTVNGYCSYTAGTPTYNIDLMISRL